MTLGWSFHQWYWYQLFHVLEHNWYFLKHCWVCLCVCVTAVTLIVSGCLLNVFYKFTLLLLISALFGRIRHKVFFTVSYFSVYYLHMAWFWYLLCITCFVMHHLLSPCIAQYVSLLLTFCSLVYFLDQFECYSLTFCLFVLFFFLLSHFTLLNIAIWTWCFSYCPFVFFFILTTFLCELYYNNNFITFLF